MHYHTCPDCHRDRPCIHDCVVEPDLGDNVALHVEQNHCRSATSLRQDGTPDDRRERSRGCYLLCLLCRPRRDAMERLGVKQVRA